MKKYRDKDEKYESMKYKCQTGEPAGNLCETLEMLEYINNRPKNIFQHIEHKLSGGK